tara:strand:- start:1546 stop:2214 length:669 start_codon:yes stop_codon:yes gene_type:complete
MDNLARSLILVCILLSPCSQAELIQWDAFETGDNLAVKDNTTGLIWLDLTLTNHLSYNDAGNAYSGWEYASADAVYGLLDSAFTDIQLVRHDTQEPSNYERNCSNTSDCYAQATNWQTLFGMTQGSRYYQTYAFGLYRDDSSRLRMAGSYLNGSALANVYGQDFDNAHNTQLSESNDLYSTFLIQSQLQAQASSTVSAGAPNAFAFLCFPFVWLAIRKKIRE